MAKTQKIREVEKGEYVHEECGESCHIHYWYDPERKDYVRLFYCHTCEMRITVDEEGGE
jgi:hypothetical protein